MQKLSIQFFMLFCLSLLSFSVSAQLTEDFEGSIPPAGWAIFDNGIGTTQSWQASTTANTGAQAASVTFEFVTGGNSTDWLVTPAVNISAGASTLAFYQRLSYDFLIMGTFTPFGYLRPLRQTPPHLPSLILREKLTLAVPIVLKL